MEGAQAGIRTPRLVPRDHAAVADRIGGEDGGKTMFSEPAVHGPERVHSSTGQEISDPDFSHRSFDGGRDRVALCNREAALASDEGGGLSPEGPADGLPAPGHGRAPLAADQRRTARPARARRGSVQRRCPSAGAKCSLTWSRVRTHAKGTVGYAAGVAAFPHAREGSRPGQRVDLQ